MIGNPAHDLIRLGLSLASAARSAELPGVTTAQMLEAMIVGYLRALADPDDADAVPEPEDVRTVRRRARARRWEHLARERLVDVEPSIPLGRNFWQLLDGEAAALAAVLAGDEVAELIRAFSFRDDDATLTLLDAAYWKKGCSSLGTLRFAALVGISGTGRNDEYGCGDAAQLARRTPATALADPRRAVMAVGQRRRPRRGARGGVSRPLPPLCGAGLTVVRPHARIALDKSRCGNQGPPRHPRDGKTWRDDLRTDSSGS